MASVKPPFLGWQEADTTVDRSVARLETLATGHYAQCTLEAGRIPDCK